MNTMISIAVTSFQEASSTLIVSEFNSFGSEFLVLGSITWFCGSAVPNPWV
jgi:hypothetical protein